MTVPPTPTPTQKPAPKRVSQQFMLVALAEGGLILAIVLFFIIEPQTMLTIVLAAAAAAVGIVAAIVAIYRAVPLMSEPTTRMLGYVSIALIVTGPLLVFAVSQFI